MDDTDPHFIYNNSSVIISDANMSSPTSDVVNCSLDGRPSLDDLRWQETFAFRVDGVLNFSTGEKS